MSEQEPKKTKIIFFGDSITDMGRNRDENADKIWKYGSGYPIFVASSLYRENPQKYEVLKTKSQICQ